MQIFSNSTQAKDPKYKKVFDGILKDLGVDKFEDLTKEQKPAFYHMLDQRWETDEEKSGKED